MPTIVDCPRCGRKLRIADGVSAATLQCPTCSVTFAPPADGQPNAEHASEAATRPCPYCREDILPTEARCRHCGEDLNDGPPPWKRAGVMRFDCEPHRGGTIQTLGIIGLMAALIAPFSVIGVPLSLSAWIMGWQDLKRMRERVMDPRGQRITLVGMRCGVIGTIIGMFWLTCFGMLLWNLG